MKLLSSSEEKQSLGNWFRQRRFAFLKERLDLVANEKRTKGSLPVRILDVGGLVSYWTNRDFHKDPDFHITLVNLKAEASEHSNIISETGDATDFSAYKDEEFDIVFSNSVIEHLHNYDNQKKMSAEVARIGRYHFIQTPNRHFFIEPHYLLPFFQFLPSSLQYKILVKTPLSRGQIWNTAFAAQYVEEIRLLTLNEMEALFPRSKIYKEKFIGLSKSFTAHNFD